MTMVTKTSSFFQPFRIISIVGLQYYYTT